MAKVTMKEPTVVAMLGLGEAGERGQECERQ